jgi:dienelactone hydrolase
MIQFQIQVRVLAKETEIPLPGLFVKAYDRDLLFDDLLGGAFTDKEGSAAIVFDESDFREFFDKHPDVYFRIYAPDRKRLLFDNRDEAAWNVGQQLSVIIRISLEQLHGVHATPQAQLFAEAGLSGEQHAPAVGESLMISAKGLAPAAAHDIEISCDGSVLFVSRLMTDPYGVLPESVLWPQFGLDDPHSDAIFTVDEAEKYWGEKKLRVRIARGKTVLAEGSAAIGAFDRPFIMNTDRDGRMLNSFERGKSAIAVSGYNIRHDGDVRVYLVHRQADWRTNDPFIPVRLTNGRPVFADARPDDRGRFRVVLDREGTVAPGAYDFIARPLRYGYEDDDDFVLRETDTATRRVTGVVIRQDYWQSLDVNGGGIMMMPLSGYPLYEPPYFRYSDAFAEGDTVYAAVDPAALPPVRMGKMAAIYVVESKTAAEWDADKSLHHLAVLGGNRNVIKFKTQAGCINHNKVLIWSGATHGSYDIVLDFGNNVSDIATFVPDSTLTIAVPPEAGDIIDGYMVPGFRVVKDPGTDTDAAIPFAGTIVPDYDEGTLSVTGDDGISRSVSLTARVKFPADVYGANQADEISNARQAYSVIIIVHGNGHSYEAYDYLLDHWAKNGFIAASISLALGQTASDRAEILFKHIEILKTKFTTHFEDNIGIMGHSRGGEAVAAAPRLNYGLPGHGHNINAVISLAPTNKYVDEHIVPPWETPYFVLYGASDADQTGTEGLPPLRGCGFALYDKAEGAKKAMLFVYGATHDRFLTAPCDPDLDYNWLDPDDRKNVLSAGAHQAIAKAYMTAFFRQQLRDETEFEGMFRGAWAPPSVLMDGPKKIELFCQYRDEPASRKTIDDFEGAHTATSWRVGTIGGAVAQAGLPVNPVEDFLYIADNTHSPHETSGLVVRWDSAGDRLDFSLGPYPTDTIDLTNYKTLSFRVAQKYDPAGTINPLNTDTDFYVLLRDLPGKERMVRAGRFNRIPYPFVRKPHQTWDVDVTKSALCTIRIPLHAFTIESAGAQRVDLSLVTKIAFIWQYQPHGEVELDEVEFTSTD